MAFDITDCRITEIHRHPRLSDRINAKVRVTLRERRLDSTTDHALTIKVWAATSDAMTSEQVRTALLARTAAILARTIEAADLDRPIAAE